METQGNVPTPAPTPRPKLDFVEVAVYKTDDGSVAAQVLKAMDGPHPRFRLRLGHVHQGHFYEGFRPTARGQDGELDYKRLDALGMADLVGRAETYMEGELAAHEKDLFARRQRSKQHTVGIGSGAPNGKTAREHAKGKHARHEANRAEKAAANRDHQKGGGGKKK